jgi:hypothetical protein
MSSLVIFQDELVDLAKLSRSQYADLWAMYETHKGSSTRYPLTCENHGSAMHLKCRGGKRLWASHYPHEGGQGCSKLVHEAEGLAHLHLKDYTVRAMSNAGFEVRTEFSTGRGTRLDVAIAAPNPFGIEAQFSPIKSGLAKARTTKSARAGWMPTWLPGTKSIGDSLAGLVPIVRHNDGIDWESGVPYKGAAAAVSLRHIRRERCTAASRWQRCPSGSKTFCGRWHPWFNDPVLGVTLDAALEGIGLGEYVLLQNQRRHVYYVPRSDVAIYQELTGYSGAYSPGLTPYQKVVKAERSTPCMASRVDEPVADAATPRQQEAARGLPHAEAAAAEHCTFQ